MSVARFRNDRDRVLRPRREDLAQTRSRGIQTKAGDRFRALDKVNLATADVVRPSANWRRGRDASARRAPCAES
jgi:hypothetical protein